ncbi:MAG: hypothetical protein K2R98_30340 [Gemmataceae bacterium]|nr:hypothetical protein [Gemmataceae bacterium]
MLDRRLRPASEPSPESINRLVADLDSDLFLTRQKAREELEKLGEAAEVALKKKLGDRPSLEMKRNIEQILARMPTQSLRTLRAVEVLEQIGSPEAKQVLEPLAKGMCGLRLMVEARASLERLKAQSAADKH